MIGIDILRGYAMINVVLYHLWDDIRFLPYAPNWYYEQLGWRIRDGEWSSIPTSLLDIVMRGGFIIATFMMLTGLSLYMATARKGGVLDVPTFLRRRLRQLLVPYWFALGMVMVVICSIAVLQMALHGQGFAYQYHHVTQARWSYIAPGRWELMASILVFPRALRSEWLMVPPSVMWFVVLFVQYYLLFPLLLPVLNRFGPPRFLLGALAVTVTAKLVLISAVGGLDQDPAKFLNHSMAIFRGFEFTLGMSLGYLFVHERARLTALVSPRGTVARWS
jgi:peptidoglycan/LPS O-acetylase OafA/YrhL